MCIRMADHVILSRSELAQIPLAGASGTLHAFWPKVASASISCLKSPLVSFGDLAINDDQMQQIEKG